MSMRAWRALPLLHAGERGAEVDLRKLVLALVLGMVEKLDDVSAYLDALPEPRRAVGLALRAIILAALPDAVEAIRYNMPAIQVNGVTVLHFAVWKKHVGLYPVYRGSEAFEREVAPYRADKDTVRFGLDEPLPVGVIEMIVRAQAERVCAKLPKKFKA
jgi:uncharacterized protein YdhG (YjbR/CyaY superfamily)